MSNTGVATVRDGARYHGDVAAVPGQLDFAVNVRRANPPGWLVRRLAFRLSDLGHYPAAADVQTAVTVAADRHSRRPEEVLALAGAAEGFALLPALGPRCAALIAPSFTEPEAVLTAAGVPIRQVVLPSPFTLAGAQVPEEADLVVIGNPTNPTGVLHRRADILALRRPGRILVIDEAFADAIPGEPESLASDAGEDLLVLRSLTKTWGLAGLRVGYALGSESLLQRLSARRPPWPVSTLALEAIAACCSPEAVAQAAEESAGLVELRAQMVAGLAEAGARVVDGSAPFVLFAVGDAERVRKHLADNGIAVRRCDTFIGLRGQYLRAAVRPEWPRLVQALAEVNR